ncbi:hypothetical protein TRVA0_027S01772 [Trichomonascus vanleenenianus]|uniref:uncharacterized protein n=1 Tax=Trichomonascus vanleenenianus TaxID=2268995 RepID=UPI003ECA8F93
MENTLSTKPETRPEEIDKILNSLERYDTENLKVFEEYVLQQANNQTTDIWANLALLKLYQINSLSSQARQPIMKEDIVTIILVKGLVRFWAADFTSALQLLPPYVTSTPEPAPESLADQCQKLLQLYSLLDGAKYSEFWNTFKKDEYNDLAADVVGFEDDLRVSIAKTVYISHKRINVSVFQEWSNLSQAKFEDWVKNTLGWTIEGDSVIVPLNKDNDAKPVITTETVRFDQLGKIIKRAYELSM